jgi:hypothetical protein
MPKFKVKAYEEVYYEAVIEADDQDEAEEKFCEDLGECHPFQTKQNFDVLEVREVKERKNA